MNLELYVITDEKISGGLSHIEIAQAAIAGGADVIQLRDKSCRCRELTRIGKAIAAMTRGSAALFIVNDRLDVALACGADGVHLGQGDIRVDTARQIAPPGFIIGVSVGSVSEALLAVKEGADYLAFSPVFDTLSKSDAGPGHGLTLLRTISDRVLVPVIAIGGIDSSNVARVFAAGADGVAVISAVVRSPDVRRAATELKSLIRESRAKEWHNAKTTGNER
jgi:thiamine-phosphate pyrophosphorylase